ncbi:MAG: synthase subunit [Streptosporangiaceae bacterium]|nr:synthase subunit [Streptosporangiaceae bacterium]
MERTCRPCHSKWLVRQRGWLRQLGPSGIQAVVGAAAFFLVFMVVGRHLVPRIQRTLQERDDAVEGGLKRALEAHAEDEQVQKDYRTALADARHIGPIAVELAERIVGRSLAAEAHERGTVDRFLDELDYRMQSSS